MQQQEALTDTDQDDRKDFLQYFWDLASVETLKRLDASQSLVNHLKKDAKETDYTLKRLVRGLASSRDAARQGFSVALTSVIHDIESISVETVLQLIKDNTQLVGSMKPMEQREMMFARLFGYMSIYRSGRIKTHGSVIAKALYEMSKWKKWFRELCIESVLLVLPTIPVETFKTELYPSIMGDLQQFEMSKWNPEQIALSTGIQFYLESKEYDYDMTSAETLTCIADTLKSSSQVYPRLHFVWSHLLRNVLATGSFATLKSFWTILVQGTLLNGSHERRGMAFKIFEILLHQQQLKSEQIEELFTPELQKCIYNNAINAKTILHEPSLALLKVFQATHPETLFGYLCESFYHPYVIEELEGMDDLTAEEEKDRQELEQRRIDSHRNWILDTMVRTCNSADKQPETQQQIITFIFYHGYCKDAIDQMSKDFPFLQTPAQGLSDKIRTNCQNRLLLCLNPSSLLNSTSGSRNKSLERIVVEENRISSLSLAKMYQIWAKFESMDVKLLAPLSKKQIETKALVLKQFFGISKRVDKAIKKSKKKTVDPIGLVPQLEVFATLFLQLGILLLDESHREEAGVAIEDLQACYDKVCPKAGTVVSETDKMQAVAVLIDMLLSLLTHESNITRSLVKLMFKSVCKDLDRSAMESMVQVVIGIDEKEEQDEDEEEEEENSEEEETDEDSDEEDDNEEMVISGSNLADVLNDTTDMEREDAALANIVRLAKEKSNRKRNEKKLRQQQTNFKLRVVDLLHLYVQQCPDSSLLYSMIVPLLRFVNSKASTQPQLRILRERIVSLLKQKISKVRGYPPITEQDDLHTMVSEIVSVAESALSKDENALCSCLLLFLIRNLSHFNVLKIESIGAALKPAVVSFFTVKQTKVHSILFEELSVRYSTVAITALAPVLVQMIQSENGATAAFTRAEAFRILTQLLRHLTEQDLPAFKSLFDDICKGLTDSLKSEDLKAKRAKIFALLGLMLTRVCLKHNLAPQLEKLNTTLTALVDIDNGPSVKTVLAQSIAMISKSKSNN